MKSIYLEKALYLDIPNECLTSSDHENSVRVIEVVEALVNDVHNAQSLSK